MPSRPSVLLCFVLLAAGTLACDEGLKDGRPCESSLQCRSLLCYANTCLDPKGDGDGDGLDNATEHELGSHPALSDSDGDGKPDGQELGGKTAMDSDGDGKPDLVESLLADGDHDCLPDERDLRDSVADASATELAGVCLGPIPAHSGVCAGQQAVIVGQCLGGALVCAYDKVPGWSAAETCDGLDNDCDGSTDEGFTYQGAPIGQPCTGVGHCGKGKVECQAVSQGTVSSGAICSTNPGGSQAAVLPEACNQQDDDCDGLTDEDFSLGGLPVGSPCLGTGECGLGTVLCGSGGTPVCSSDPGQPGSKASPEVCNGRDDDCDGQSDEGIVLGSQALGQPCEGKGICSTGLVVCSAAGQPVCSTAPGGPQSKATAEACNGLDDDCDGTTDEGFQFQGAGLGEPCEGAGECGAGTVTCGKSGAVTCSTSADGPESQAKPELCNGLDDDCDGQTDEKLTWQNVPLGGVCTGTGACGKGVVECGALGAVTCSSNADGSQPEAKAETCNGADDDCDGTTDEGISAPAASGCPTAGVCKSAIAQMVCTSGQWTCDFTGQPGFEGPAEVSCDGLDNDCDGTIDEGLAVAWSPVLPLEDGRPLARSEFAFSVGGGDLFVTGGVVGHLGPGKPPLSGDLWRLEPQTGLWKHVLSHPGLERRLAGTVWLPASVSAPHPRLWLVGGQLADGNPAPPLSIDLTSAQIEPQAWQVGKRLAPALVHVAQTQQTWLVGGATEPSDTAALRYDPDTDAWTAEVPQPPLTGPTAACVSADGHLFVFGLGLGNGTHFARLAPGAATWQTLPAGDVVPTAVRALVCDAVPGEVWLIGAALNGKSLGIRRYATVAKTWSTAPDPSWPGWTLPAAGRRPDGTLIVTLGDGADGLPQPRTLAGLPGKFQPLEVQPETVVGAAWLRVGADLWRVGGAQPRGTKLDTHVAAWRKLASGWQRFDLPAGVAGRAQAAVATDAAGKVLYLWGGMAAPGTGAQLLGTEVQASTPGGLSLDLQTGAWTELSGAVPSYLPSLKADPAVTATNQPGLWFTFSGGSQPGSAELWRVDLAKNTTIQAWHTGQSLGPAFRRGAAMTHDPVWNRLIVALIDGSLQVWTYGFGISSGWSLIASDPTVTSGRVSLVGGLGDGDRLLVVTPPLGSGSPAQLRALQLGPQPALQPVKVAPPSWIGAVSVGWDGTRALVDGFLLPNGTLRPGLDQVLRACP